MSVHWLRWGVYLGQTSKPLHSDYNMFKDCCLFSILAVYGNTQFFFFFSIELFFPKLAYLLSHTLVH